MLAFILEGTLSYLNEKPLDPYTVRKDYLPLRYIFTNWIHGICLFLFSLVFTVSGFRIWPSYIKENV